MDIIEKVRLRTLSSKIDSATSKIAPLWPLSHFVAVNPFIGFADQDFAYTAEAHKRVQGSDLVMPITWFKEKFESGDVRLENLRAAVAVATPEIVESFESADQLLSAENVV
ncbi:MAG: putative inorganic carbon transporter subunit DabA, partial [Verrucomicrobiota bacterium]|nr:putative inorganic carbon transporter subunit DabA [Verrucomicrobiota bacterium]